MIKFIRQQELFVIENEKISYLFMINSHKILQHLYFGNKIDEVSIMALTNLDVDWSKTYYDYQSKNEKTYEDNFYDGRSMLEIPSFGRADKRGAQFILSDTNDLEGADFRYHSHRIYRGKPNLEVLPAFRDDGDVETLEISLFDERTKVELLTSYTIYQNHNVILRNNKIINHGAKIRLNRAYSFNLDIPQANLKLMHFPGDWINERREQVENLNYGLKRLYSNFGRSSHEQNPVAIITAEDTTQITGISYGFSFVYSGNFSIDINVDKLKMTRVLMGINDEQFSYTLDKNESFIIPEGIIVFSNTGIEGVTQTFHNVIRQHLIPKRQVNQVRPVLLNSWEGCYMTFDTEMIIDYIDIVAKMGIELFVLDDGWFGKRDDDSKSLGDWHVNKSKIDLEKIIAHCHRRNLKFGLWFEPEMINFDSDLFRQHPEFALGYQDSNRSLSRHQFVLDTCNDEAIENVYGQMKFILDNYEIDYVKWDHNRNVYDAISSSLAPQKQGETYHRLMLGSYKLIHSLVQEYPNILFESCASGGGRYDLGMLYYMPQIWTSDEMDPFQRLFIQYSTSRIYPLSTMGAHIGKQTTGSYATKAKISTLGVYGLEIDPRTLNAEDIKDINKITDIYKKNRDELIINGNIFHLSSPYTSNYMGMMSVSEKKDKALVLFSNIKKENIEYRFLKLRGLDPDKKYQNDFDQQVHTGKYYSNVGLNMSKGLAFLETFLIQLTEVPVSFKEIT